MKYRRCLLIVVFVLAITTLTSCFTFDLDLPLSETTKEEATPLVSDAAYAIYAVPSALKQGRPHPVDVLQLPTAYIERVVDGDTVIVHYQGDRDRLRLLGIDAPESSSNPDESKQTEEGDIVSDIVKELLTGRTVYLEFDESPRDQYGRLLAYVWLDADTQINETLVLSGLATVVRFPPNTAYYQYFRTLNEEAKARDLGFYKDRWGK